MKYKFVRLGSPERADMSDMFVKLGLPHGHKWPAEGIAPMMMDGIKVWVKPANPKEDKAQGVRKSSKHRVMCECPGCKRTMSAGRLFQHKCVLKKRASRSKAALAAQGK